MDRVNRTSSQYQQCQKNVVKATILILSILSLMVALRIVHIEHDPPHSLNLWQGCEFNDEGFKILCARNRVLFGDWKWSEYDNYPGWLKSSPLGVRLYYLTFSVFEFGIAQARWLNCFFGVLTLIFFFFFVNNIADRKTAYLSTILLGFNFQFIMYNRLALWETFLTFFIVLSIFFWSIKTTKWKFLTSLAAIVALYCAFLIKPSVMVFLFSILPGVTIHYWKHITTSLRKLSVLKILVALLCLISLLFLIKEQADIALNLIFIKATKYFSLKYFFQNYIVEHFVRQPVITLLLILYVYDYLANFRKRVKNSSFDIVMISWVLISYLMITSLTFNPIRYYIFMLPAECYLAAMGISVILSGTPSLTKEHIRRTWGVVLILAFFELSIIFAGLFELMIGNIDFGSDPGLSYTGNLYLSSFASICLSIMFIFALRKSFEIGKLLIPINYNGRKVAILLCSLSLVINLSQYTHWYIYSEPIIVNYSKNLKDIVGDKVVGGAFMPVLCIANDLRCVKVFFGSNDTKDTFLKIEPSYMTFDRESISTNKRGRFKQEFYKKFPNIMANSKLVRTYLFGSGRFSKYIELYEMNYDSVADR